MSLPTLSFRSWGVGRRSARVQVAQAGGRCGQAAGDALVELETEKIDLEVSADRAGVLSSIKHAEGADVKVGEVLAVLEASAAQARRTRRLKVARRVPRVPQDAGGGPARDRTQRRPGCQSHADRPQRRAGRRREARIGRALERQPRDERRCPASRPRPRRRPPLPHRRPRHQRTQRTCRTQRTWCTWCSREPSRGARAHVQAPRDDRPPPRRGTTHRRHAHHLQRGGHDRRDGAARAPQGGVSEAARRRARHRLLLRQGRVAALKAFPAAQRRDSGRRDRPQALLRHRYGRRRRRRAGGSGHSGRGSEVASRRSSWRFATSPRAPRTAR
jgi:pyruvate/2-oxoglutarate dehydrogenase complex dihydrolipoamide acyltransferase (E2) component